MTDTIPMGPEDIPRQGEAGVSDSTRKCSTCGELYSGELHFACLADNKTIRDEDRTVKDPATDRSNPKSSRGTIDDIPEEAAVHSADITRQINQYILVRQIGKGGMGAVWKAWDKKLTRWVAIKFLLAEDEEGVDRFLREAKLAARLRHPNIAAIYEVGDAPSREAGQSLRHYLAMEYIDGNTLADAKLSRPQLLVVFEKVARAIDAAHKGGVVHRDLKPPNIMITHDLWPYVMDFGVAKALAQNHSLSVSGLVMGTPAYMPPEQAEGRISDIDGRSDVYSLGATMYSVLLGRPPHEGTSAMEILRKVSSEPVRPPRQIDPAFPVEIEAILLKAMAMERKNRYQTAAALAEDILRILDGRRAEIPPPPPPPVMTTPPQRKKGGKSPMIAVLVLLLAAGGTFVWRSMSGPPAVPPIAKPKDPAPPPPEPGPVIPPKEVPVEAGLFALKIAVHPFAQIVSISRDGEPVRLEQAAAPVLIPDLRIGTYELLLRHPQLGERKVLIPRDRIKAGKTYVVWGQMDKPALEVKELP
jgi:serine/threonine protein kinase